MLREPPISAHENTLEREANVVPYEFIRKYGVGT